MTPDAITRAADLAALAWQLELGADEAIGEVPVDRFDRAPASRPAVEGYLVTIPNGTHVTAHTDIRHLFHYDEVRFSGDGEYHACILPSSQEPRCLYVPRLGF